MQHESNPTTNTTTLEEVQKNFQQWRKQKHAHNCKTPDYLWDQVALIVEDYRMSDILKHLKITKRQLVTAMKSRKDPKNMDAEIASTSKLMPDNITQEPFFKFSMPSIPDSDSYPDPNLRLPTSQIMDHKIPKVEPIHPNGITLRMTEMANHHLSTLLLHL